MIPDKKFFENNDILKEIGIKTHEEASAKDKEHYDFLCRKKVLTFDELMSLPSQPNDYLIENFLWKKQSIMISAKYKVGKSTISKQMAFALTCGQPFLNSYDVSGKYNVVYVQTEGSREGTKEDFGNMMNVLDIDPKHLFYMYKIGMRLHEKGGADDLIDEIRSIGYRPDVVILDCLYKAMSGGDLSNAKDVTVVTDNIDKIKESFNCAFIGVHHKRKGSFNNNGHFNDGGDDESLGSVVFQNYFDHMLNLKKRKLKDGTEPRTLYCDTQRNGNVETKIELDYDEHTRTVSIKDAKKSCPASEEAVFKMIKTMGEACSKDIHDSSGMAAGTVRNAISALKRSGKIIKSKNHGKYVYYKEV